MTQSRLGMVASGADAAAVLADIKRAEDAGIQAAWLTTGGVGLDALTMYAGAAVGTQQIMLGTSITPTFPRHPLVAAQQAQVIDQLAPGRFRLGVGPSNRTGTAQMFGVNYRAPLGHLIEYLRILKAILQTGSVDIDGRYYQAHARISSPMDIPVMASALGPKAFEMCGVEADGAISWVCPGAYLRDVAIPAMKAGAQQAGRPVPPLIAHAIVCVHENTDEVRAAVRQQFGGFARLPFYQQMFIAAGFPETSQGDWSNAMIDGVVLWGSESQVAEKLKGLFSLGATEVMASPMPAGSDPDASRERTLRLLAQVSKSATQ